MIKIIIRYVMVFAAGCAVSYQLSDDIAFYYRMAKTMGGQKDAIASDTAAREAILSGQAWGDFIQTLDQAGKFILSPGLNKSSQEIIEGHHYLMNLLHSSLAMIYHHGDPNHAAFVTAQDVTKRFAAENPDAIYAATAIRGDASYRIWGNVGSITYLGFMTSNGGFTSDNEGKRIVANLNNHEMKIEPNGDFGLILSPERPLHATNWMKQEADSNQLTVRQYYADWDETPAQVHIERIDKRDEPLQVNAIDMIERMNGAAMFVSGGARMIHELIERDVWSSPPNTVSKPHLLTHLLGTGDQMYSGGHWQLAADEALVLEFDKPESLLWQIQINGSWDESGDYQYRHTSLNWGQMIEDSDGKIRFIIAHDDPGMPNWLDTSRRAKGSFTIRYNQATRLPETTTATVVKLNQVQAMFPGDTPRVSQQQRTEIIDQRRRQIARRFNPIGRSR